MNYKDLIIGVLGVALVVVVGLNYFAPKLGIGEVTGWQSYSVAHFHEGFYVGTSRQLNIDRTGLLTTSGGITNSGTLTQSGTLTVSGAATLSGVNTLSGATTASAAFTTTGESRINMPRSTGSVLSPATSSVITITDTQFCDNAIISLGDWTPAASSTAILNLPTAESVFANCLPTDGDRFSLIIENNASASASSTLITVGSASTTLYGVDTSEDVLLGGSRAFLEVWRASPTSMEIGIQLWVEAD